MRLSTLVVMLYSLITLACFLLSAPTTRAANWYVDPVLGNDTKPNCGMTNGTGACMTILAAMAKTGYQGDTVWLADGVYCAAINYNINFGNSSLKPVTIRSVSGDPNRTIIDGYCNGTYFTGSNVMVTLPDHKRLPSVILSYAKALNITALPVQQAIIGIKFRNLYTTTSGSAINWQTTTTGVLFGNELTVSNCIFDNCACKVGGGAIYVFQTLPAINSSNNYPFRLDNCLFVNNSNTNPVTGAVVSNTLGGPAMMVSLGNALIINSTFANHWVAPVLLTDSGTVELDNNVYTNNVNGAISIVPHYNSAGVPPTINVTITGSTFANNVITGAFGLTSAGTLLLASAVYFTGTGTLTINSSIFANNTAWALVGAAIVGQHTGVINVYQSTFVNNSASSGGVVASGNSGTINFYDSVFTDNRATKSGGVAAMAFDQGEMLFQNCTFIGNTAGQFGGVVDATPIIGSNSNVVLLSSSFLNNYANDGSIASCRVSGAGVSIISSSAINHSVGRTGAILYNHGGQNTIIANSTFIDSSSPSNGGSIYVSEGSIVMITSSSFIHSVAALAGGALYIEEGASVAISSSSFENNTSPLLGGAVYDGARSQYDSTVFSTSTANLGGAIYFAAPVLGLPAAFTCGMMMNNVSFVNNVAVRQGGAIYWEGLVPSCLDACGSPIAYGTLATNLTQTTSVDVNGITSSLFPSTSNIVFDLTQATLATRVTSSVVYQSNLCYFENNTAGSGAGSNYAFNMHHLVLVSVTSLSLSPHTSSDSLVLASTLLQEMNLSHVSSVSLYPGLPLDLVLALEDDSNRVVTVTNGGAYGATISLAVRTSSHNTSYSLSAGITTTSAVDGFVFFYQLSLLQFTETDAPALHLQVTTDPVSTTLVIPVTFLPCPDKYILTTSTTNSAYSTCVPRPTYLPGQSVSVSISGEVILFSYAISVVGVWTALIVIEQAVSAVARKKNSVKWIGLSSVSFSIGGVWCAGVIGMTSLNFPDGLLYTVHVLYIMGALLLTMSLSFVGFWLVMSGTVFTVSGKRGSTIESRQYQHVSSRTITEISRTSEIAESSSTPADNSVECGREVLTTIHGGEEEHEYPITAHQHQRRLSQSITLKPNNFFPQNEHHREKRILSCNSHGSFAVSASGVTTTVTENSSVEHIPQTTLASVKESPTAVPISVVALPKRRRYEWLHQIVRNATQPRILAGCSLVYLSIVLPMTLLVLSLSSQVTIHVGAGLLTTGYIVTFVTGMPSTSAFFLFYRKGRILAAFIMGFAITFVFYANLYSNAYSYSLSPTFSASSYLIVTDNLKIIVLGISIASCLVCMGLNISGLKLSRHQLTQTLRKETSKALRVKHRLATTKIELDRFRVWNTMMSTCRPMFPEAGQQLVSTTVGNSDLAITSSLMTLAQLFPELRVDLDDQERKLPLPSLLSLILDKYGLGCNNSQLQVMAKKTRLVDILQHPFAIELFKDYMIQTHNEDLVMCYLSLRRFRDIEPGAVLEVMARVCYERFVADGSPLEANVPSQMKKHVKDKMDAKSFSADMFDEICNEVYKLMVTNSWKGYCSTLAYIASLQVLRAAEGSEAQLQALRTRQRLEADQL